MNVAKICMRPTRQLRPQPLDFSTSSFPISRATLALNATPSPSLELEKELHGQYMVYLCVFMFIDLSILEPAAHPSLCAVNTTTTVRFSYWLRLILKSTDILGRPRCRIELQPCNGFVKEGWACWCGRGCGRSRNIFP